MKPRKPLPSLERYLGPRVPEEGEEGQEDTSVGLPWLKKTIAEAAEAKRNPKGPRE